tara:strand:+ start:1752 stop:2036 length:285 start_codon:yes stop_codon:yes gene_type:complete
VDGFMDKKIVKTEKGATLVIPAGTRIEAALKYGKAVWQAIPEKAFDRFSDGQKIIVSDSDGEEEMTLIFSIEVIRHTDDDPTEEMPSEFETSVQ